MRFFLLVSLCLVVVAPCAAQSSRASGDPAGYAQPLADTLRALVVLAKFRDDEHPGDPKVDFRQWPLFEDPATLPPFARPLLAETPTPPYPDSSLTAYLHQQSLGRFVLYGNVLDSVMVSLRPEAAYHRPAGGYGFLTAEILDRLDAAGFDFSRYDHNRDGQLDYLFLIIRRDTQRDAKRFVYTGISCLDARCGGGISGGRPRDTLVYDGLRVDWQRSGSILLHGTPGNILPHYYHVRLMAHELGHDLWAPFFNHIRPLDDNDVPARSARGNQTDVVGYALMPGAGGAWDARGDETISAFERELLGWIDCAVLATPRDDILLADLYTTSDCKKITLDGSGRVLYLTNRQRLGPFDRRRRGGRDGQFAMGLLRATGLLVHLADGFRLDVLPADNSLDLSPRDAPYQGDLFGPATRRQLTPWTRPNTSGFTRYPPGFAPSWQAVDNIREMGRSMIFDYVEDFRQRPTIREDSWIGEETKGYRFEAPVVVARDTLHVGTALTLGGGLRVADGATVIVEAGAEVDLPPESVLEIRAGGVVVVEGVLRLRGLLKLVPGGRLVSGGSGAIRVR